MANPFGSVRRRTSRIYYGWYIVASAAAIAALNSALYLQAFGLYIVHLESTFGWSRTTLSGAYSLARLEGGVFGPLEGWMVDKFGPRVVMRIGIVFTGVGLMLLGQVHALFFYYAVILLISVGTALTAFLTVASTVSRWFVRHRTKAIAFSLAGGSIGGFIGIPIMAFVLESLGWRTTSLLSGILVLVVGLPLSSVFRYTPEHYGMRPDGDPPPQDEEAQGASQSGSGSSGRAELDGFTLRQAFRTRAFWLMGFGQATATLAVSIITLHLILFLKDEYGISTVAAAPFFSTALISQFIGQIVGGFVSDKLNKRFVAAGAMLATGVGLLLLSIGPPLGFVFIFAVLHGSSAGFRFPLMASIRADYFGTKRIGTILGFGTFLSSIGTTVGPVFGGFMYDVYGSYQVAFLTVAIISAVGAASFLFATKPKLPVPAATPAPEHSP